MQILREFDQSVSDSWTAAFPEIRLPNLKGSEAWPTNQALAEKIRTQETTFIDQRNEPVMKVTMKKRESRTGKCMVRNVEVKYEKDAVLISGWFEAACRAINGDYST